MTFAPRPDAISQVWSVLPESTSRISSAQETDLIASAIFPSSLNAMITADIFTAVDFGRLGEKLKVPDGRHFESLQISEPLFVIGRRFDLDVVYPESGRCSALKIGN